MIFKDESAAKKWVRDMIEFIKEYGLFDDAGRSQTSLIFTLDQNRLRNELMLYGIINISVAPKNITYHLSEKFFNEIEKLEYWAASPFSQAYYD